MPYIDKERRADLDHRSQPQNAGELNYVCTMAAIEADRENFFDFPSEEIEIYVRDYLNRKGLCYANINEVIGVLMCAGLEFRRRTGRDLLAREFSALALRLYSTIAAPYEDAKIKENGDITYE